MLQIAITGTALDPLFTVSVNEDVTIEVCSDSDDSDSRATTVNTYKPSKRDFQTQKTYNKAHIVRKHIIHQDLRLKTTSHIAATKPPSTDGVSRRLHHKVKR
jgi:hypothetical protein